MDNYVRCGFSVIPVTKKGPEKEPSESPLLAAVGNFVQRLIPDGLAKAPQRLQAAHGIDPRITAGFTADILGITLVAATAGSGTPVATLLRRVATRHGIDLRKVTAPVEEIIAMGLLNATREEGSTLATMLKRMATREQARVAQTIPSQIVVYPSSDFYGFFRRNVNKEPFVKGQPFIKTDYNTPKLFTTRDYQVVVATLRNPKGETAELAFSAMRCTDEGLSDTWTVYIDRLLATGAVMGESTRPAGFYRAADHFIKNWLEEKGASRALGQHFIEPSKYSLMGKEEAGVIGKRITQIVERRHLYHGEKPLLHRNILQEHSAAKHNLLSVFNGPQNRLFPTFEIPLRPKSTPKPLFPQQKKPPLVLQREAQQLEISLPPQGVQTKKAVTTTAVYQRSYPRQGDLMWANLGPSVGAELGGERLCVVLSNNLINKQGRTVTLAPLNENPSAHFDIRLFVLDKTRSMQPTQMKTIDQTRLLGEKIGLLNDSARKEVQETLKTLFAMKGCQQVAGMNTYFPLHVSDLGKIFEHPFPKQGTLYWADLGPTLGHELGKRRPVIILPNDMVNQLASTTLVAPFKGKTIPLQRFPKAEDIVPDLCRVIDKSRLDAPIQVLLNPNAMQRIEEALKRVFTIEGTYVVFVQNR
jgi:mRNA interferase MazF